MEITRKESTLFKNTVIYAIGNFSTKILSFLIVPLYTHYITTADMGVYDLIVTTLTFLSPVLLLQLTDGIYRWLLDSEANISVVLRSGFTYILINMLIFLAFGIPFILIMKIKYGLLIVGMLLAQSVFALLQQATRGLKHNRIYITSGIIHTVVFLGLNVVQIVLLGQGIVGLLESQIISCVIGVVYMLAVQKEILSSFFVKVDNSIGKEMLKYSLPLMPNAISWSIVNMSDRYIIRYFMDNSANGIYSISYKFPAVVQIFTNFFYMAWQESSILEYNSEDRDAYYSRIFSGYYKFLFPLILALMPLTQFYVVFSMEASYQSAWLYTGFLYLGTVFSALSSFLGTGYQSSKKSMGAFATTMIAAAVNVGINILTIRYIGLQAAALSTFISYLILFIIRVFHTRKFFHLEVNWTEFSVIASLTSLAIVSYILVDNIIYKVFYQLIAIAVFAVMNKNLISVILKKMKNKCA